MSLTENDVYLAALPAESNLAFGCPGIVGTLSAGGTVVLVENPDLVDDCLAAVERERATITSVTPDAARHWTDALPTARADLSSLRLLQVGGGAPLPRAGAERIGPAWGGRLQQVFAMAEGCSRSPGPPIRTKPCAPRRSARSHPTTRSASSTRTAGTYPTGSPANSSPAARTPRGYYRAPDHNARSFTADGYFRTGELARRTPEGGLVMTGRLREGPRP